MEVNETPTLYTLKDGVFNLNFHPAQTEAWDAKERIIAMLCGSQVGKTEFGVQWLKREIENTYNPDHKNNDYLIVTTTIPLLDKKLQPEFLNVFKDIWDLGTFLEGKRIFKYHDKNIRILLCSAENPDSIEAATAKAVWLDEAGQDSFRRQTWDAILRRLNTTLGRILITTTLYNWGWLKTEVYDRWLNGDQSIRVIHADSILNPAFPKESWDRARDTMPSWKFDMQYRGRYSKPAGMIYDCFGAQCIKKRFPIPQEWQRYVGMDFGTESTAAIFLAKDPSNGDLYVYREYIGEKKSVPEHAEHLKDVSKGENIVKIKGGIKGEEGWRLAYRNAGWYVTEPLIKDVEEGINKVYALLKLNKLYFFDDLHESIDEISKYSRVLDENNNYQPTDKIKDKEWCFIAGTKVQTINGEKNIESVKAGDLVATRQGYFPISSCGMTGINKETLKVTFSNGTHLIGTPNHKIWVKGKGYTPLHALRYCDIMETWKEKRLFTRDLSITDIRNQNLVLPECIFRDLHPEDSIVSFGRMPMVQSLKGVMSTIKMATHSIMNYRTWNVCQLGNIVNYQRVIRIIRNTLNEYSRLLLRGTSLMLAESGTVYMVERHGNAENQLNIPANNVVVNIKVLNQVTTGFAQTNAKRDGVISAVKMTWLQSVLYVIKNLSPISILRKSIAPVYVTKIEPSEKSTVYNLSVNTVHEYFANGVLVSNCHMMDSLRYICAEFNASPQVNTDKVKVFRI